MNPDELIGQQLSDRLRLSAFIAKGPNSQVFEADLLALKRAIGKCAVKIAFPAERQDPDELLSEVRGQKATHPGMPPLQTSGVLRSGPAAGAIYLGTELADTTLEKLHLEGETLDAEEGEALARSLLEVLEYLQAHGREHGRLRPSNLLRIGQSWKVSGLELQPIRERLQEVGGETDQFLYRAPESFEQDTVGPEADLWSAGLLLHLALSGKLPFEKKESTSKGDMIWRILNQPPQLESLPEKLEPLVHNLLRRDPKDRWTVERAIAYLDGREPVDEPPVPEPQEPDKGEGHRPVIDARAEDEAREKARKKEKKAVAPRKPVALYLNPYFIFLLVLFLFGGMAIGYGTARDPIRPRRNVPPEQLYPVNYEVVSIDPKGRFPSRRPGQAVGFAEDLGEGIAIEMIQVVGGTFWMGTPPDEPQRETLEGPQHQVTVRSFYMSRYEITQKQWRVVASMPAVRRNLPASPALTKGDGLPVESVSWEDCQEFLDRLSRQAGRRFRLPTEAEWEYACRAGSVTPFTFGMTLSSEIANYQADATYGMGMKGVYRLRPVDVGSLGTANSFGLYDVHGNVWEWCQDYYGPYPAAAQYDPLGPDKGQARIMRGGGWQSLPWRCRSGSRAAAAEDFRRSDLGLRVVLPETYYPEEP